MIGYHRRELVMDVHDKYAVVQTWSDTKDASWWCQWQACHSTNMIGDYKRWLVTSVLYTRQFLVNESNVLTHWSSSESNNALYVIWLAVVNAWINHAMSIHQSDCEYGVQRASRNLTNSVDMLSQKRVNHMKELMESRLFKTLVFPDIQTDFHVLVGRGMNSECKETLSSQNYIVTNSNKPVYLSFIKL